MPEPDRLPADQRPAAGVALLEPEDVTGRVAHLITSSAGQVPTVTASGLWAGGKLFVMLVAGERRAFPPTGSRPREAKSERASRLPPLVSSRRRGTMQRAYGLEIPQTLQEVCDPRRMALLVYDMQAGIVRHVPDAEAFIARVVRVVEAARRARMRVIFARHLSLPNELAGVFQLRTAMAWQRVERVEDVRPLFLRDAPDTQLVPELAPLPSEAVFDKLAMSMFVGTPWRWCCATAGSTPSRSSGR